MAFSSDPISQVEAALFWALFSHQPLAALVRPRNRITMATDAGDPTKDVVADADLPELVMLPAGGSNNSPGTGVSSSSTSNVLRYQIGITTADLRTTQRTTSIGPVKSEVFRALTFAFRVSPGSRQHFILGLPFVNWVGIGDFADALTDPERNAPGWHSAVGVEVRIAQSILEVAA